MKLIHLAFQYQKTTALILLIIAMGAMRYFDSFLKNQAAPGGIVDLEFAKTTERSSRIIASWDETSKLTAGMSMGFDHLFIVVYCAFIILLLKEIMSRSQEDSVLYRISSLLIYAVLFAGLCDVIENYGLIRQLLGDMREAWALTSFYFAFVKFATIGLVLLFIIFFFARWVLLQALRR